LFLMKKIGSITLVVLTAHHRPTWTSCNSTCRLTQETCYSERSCTESNDTKLNLNLLGTGENMLTFPLGCNQQPIGQHLLYNIGLHTTIQERDTI
jgi:translation initiation factor 2B subunit (eIF-2B alpha/beta/delta family)